MDQKSKSQLYHRNSSLNKPWYLADNFLNIAEIITAFHKLFKN